MEKKYYGTFGKYNLIKPLGEQHIFPVYLAQKQGFTETVVLKTMSVDDDSYQCELNVFKLPVHKHIVKCLGKEENQTAVGSEICQTKKGRSNSVIMELVPNGDLYQYLIQGKFGENTARYYFEQLLDAIEHLHKNNYCHLDIKPENILIDEEFNLKLTDFGFATYIGEGKRIHERSGTERYMSPEAFRGTSLVKGYDGCKADIFALGIILFIMVSGSPPFAKASSDDAWYRPALAGNWDKFWAFKEKRRSFNPEFKKLMTSLLSANPESRLTPQKIRESAWYRNVTPASKEEVRQLMQDCILQIAR